MSSATAWVAPAPGKWLRRWRARAWWRIDPSTAGKEELRAAIVDANERISARSLAEPRLLGMGTTLTSALMRDGVMLLGHVGDSRAYLLHEGELRQLTDDHSWVGRDGAPGEITAAEAAVHPHRSVITKALGTDGEVEPDILEVPLVPGDRLMLCSDGLSGMVSDDTIQELLRLPDPPQAVADALIAAALKGGGEDNVTVVVVRAKLLADEDAEAAPRSPRRPAVPAEDEVILGPTDRGQERSSVPGFMRPALGSMGAKLSRRPPIWARPAPHAVEPDASQEERLPASSESGSSRRWWSSSCWRWPSRPSPSSTRTSTTWAPPTGWSPCIRVCPPRCWASSSRPSWS